MGEEGWRGWTSRHDSRVYAVQLSVVGVLRSNGCSTFTYTHPWVVHMRVKEQCKVHLMTTGSLCWVILQTLKDG